VTVLQESEGPQFGSLFGSSASESINAVGITDPVY
jgi:hypothetical protein